MHLTCISLYHIQHPPCCFKAVFVQPRPRLEHEWYHTYRENSHQKPFGQIQESWPAGPNFIPLLSTKICLAWHFCSDKNRNANQISTWFSRQAHHSWIPVRSNMQQKEIWLIILFLSRKKISAKQIFVLAALWNWALLSSWKQNISLSKFFAKQIMSGAPITPKKSWCHFGWWPTSAKHYLLCVQAFTKLGPVYFIWKSIFWPH